MATTHQHLQLVTGLYVNEELLGHIPGDFLRELYRTVDRVRHGPVSVIVLMSPALVL